MIEVRQCPTEAMKWAEYIINSAFNVIDDLTCNGYDVKGIGIASTRRINVEEGIAFYKICQIA